MSAGVALILAAALGADVHGDAGIRVEAASRTNDTRGFERVTTAEVVAVPEAAVQALGPAGELRARYAPILRMADALTSAEPDVVHAATLEARLRLPSRWSLDVLAMGQKGTTDLVSDGRLAGSAPGAEPTPPRAIPTTAPIRYAAAAVDARLLGAPDPRSTVTLTAGAFAGGGDDGPSRNLMPFERGLRMGATVDWNATRRDVIGVQGNASSAWYTGGTEAAIASLTAGWRHRFALSLEARARAGATATFDDALAGGAPGSFAPAGELGVAHASERLHLREEAVVRATASLDRVRGTADPEVDAEVSARWLPAQVWSLVGRAVGSLVFQDAGETRRGTFEVRMERALSRHTALGLGMYGLWQRSPDPVLPSFAEVGAFASVAFDVRGAGVVAGAGAGVGGWGRR